MVLPKITQFPDVHGGVSGRFYGPFGKGLFIWRINRLGGEKGPLREYECRWTVVPE